MYINIGNRREVLWDDFLIDKEQTTARLTMHRPEKKELAFVFDKPWEGDGVSYSSTILVEGVYRMYYVGGMIVANGEAACRSICMMESRDMLHWERPSLGMYEFEGSKENNIILRQRSDGDFEEALDNLFVFVDENPACPAEEKIKGVGMCYNHAKEFPADRELWCYVSSDGIHFKLGWKMTDGSVPNGGIFDSLNTAFYDSEDGFYKAFVRGIHKRYENDEDIRDVRYMESKDFRNWSEPVRLCFGEQDDYPLYTNQVTRYARAPHMYIGFPSRYVERKEWSKNFDLLGGEENARRRRERMRDNKRFGLVLTDCVFMSSRDGVNWNRFDEMFIGPGLEHERNWVYGDSSYPFYTLVETPCEYPSREKEISIMVTEGHWSGVSSPVYRYSMRLDGFASYRSDYQISTLTTKPLIFSGEKLSINFSTSAIGWIYVDILDINGNPIEKYHSCELFGNSLDREVWFGGTADVSALAGRPVRLRFTMRDADIYSFVFR